MMDCWFEPSYAPWLDTRGELAKTAWNDTVAVKRSFVVPSTIHEQLFYCLTG